MLKLPIDGIKIKKIAYVCITICIVFMVIIYIEISRVDTSYKSLIDNTKNCIEGQKCAISLERSSDYLTEQVRLFVVRQDYKNLRQYFDEIESKNREKMVDRLAELYSDTEPNTVARLKDALRESNELEKLENHAMCLVAKAADIENERLPDEVAQWKLTAKENSMTDEELKEHAYDLVYGTEYLTAKSKIKAGINGTLDLITAKMAEKQNESGNALNRAFIEQRVFIFLMMLLICVEFWVIGLLIIYPIREHIRSIRSGKKWKIIGVYEMRYLAHVYNHLYDRNEAHNRDLEYQANHDALTGIYNRAAFEKKKDSLMGRKVNVALILADINEFKKVNDTLGHKTGDETIKKVADIFNRIELKNKYCVARIGGDEFAIILKDVRQEVFSNIEKEVLEMNRKLASGVDNIPKVSVSVGVAFSEEGYSNDLFRHADQALYHAKKYGSSGCCLYEELCKHKENEMSALIEYN